MGNPGELEKRPFREGYLEGGEARVYQRFLAGTDQNFILEAAATVSGLIFRMRESRQH